jgi:hypothetical protein
VADGFKAGDAMGERPASDASIWGGPCWEPGFQGIWQAEGAARGVVGVAQGGAGQATLPASARLAGDGVEGVGRERQEPAV